MATEYSREQAVLEYERLCRWRNAWSRLAANPIRLRRLGGLQSTQDKIEGRAKRCNAMIAALLKKFDRHSPGLTGASQGPGCSDVVELRKLAAEASAKLQAANWPGVAGGTWWRRDDVLGLVNRLDQAAGQNN